MLKQTMIVSSSALFLSLGAADAQQAKRGQLRIPVPDAVLLKPQPEPICEYTAADQLAKRTADQPKGGDAALEAAALRTKLDYERQCYRHAEMIVRQRLHALQASMRSASGAIERSAEPRRAGGSRAGRPTDRDALGNEPPNYQSLREYMLSR